MKNDALRNFLIYAIFFAVVGGLLGLVYFSLNNTDKVLKLFSKERSFLGIRCNEALVIDEVTPNSPAEEAGIKANDKIVSIDGVKMLSAEETKRTISVIKPGSTIKIVVFREVLPRGKYQFFQNILLSVTLIRWPDHIPE